MIRISLTLISTLLLMAIPSCQTGQQNSTPWEYPLYLGNQGMWKQRIPVVVMNNSNSDLKGDPVTLKVGRGKGKLRLAGTLAESLRVTNERGDQLLFRLDNQAGLLVEEGPILNGSSLTFPLENLSGEQATYFIYLKNDKAWPVGEYLYTHREITNGGFEEAGQFGPLAWELEWPEEGRDVKWCDSLAHEGKFSVEVHAKNPKGKGAYGAVQSDLHLIPGATYLLEAWFRTDDLDGEAGLMGMPGNLERTKRNLDLETLFLKAHDGSEEWTRASLEFVAPAAANTLTLSTYLRGSGTLRVDDVELICLDEQALVVEVQKLETSPLLETGRTDLWYGNESELADSWPVRAAVSIPNFTDQDLLDQPVYVDIQQVLHRLWDETDDRTLLQLTDGMDPIPHKQMGNAVLFRQDIPAHSYHTFYLYFSDRVPSGSMLQAASYASLSEITENLISNPGFDQSGLSDWKAYGETGSKQAYLDEDEDNAVLQIRFRQSEDESSRMISDIETSHTEAGAEVGVTQTVDVVAGSSYFFSAQVRSSNILDRPRTIRISFQDVSGEQVGETRSLQANPDMHQNFEWVQNTLIVEAPREASQAKVELLNTVEGQVWFDEVYFLEIQRAYSGAMEVERLAERKMEGLQVWEKNPVAKVFPDDLPTEQIENLVLSAAKNDVEPVQILFRSQEAYTDLELRLNPLEDQKGNALKDIDIGMVGYVMINYPSNYYRDFVTPFWRTKIPTGKIGSDGWTGWWADPILPFSSFDLPANKTKAAWIEVAVPEDAVPGEYTGSVQLLHKGEVIREIPLDMKVYNFSLPEATSMKATYVPRFNETQMFGRDLSDQEWNYKLWKYMARHRISPETIRPYPEYTVENDEVILDFTAFDKAAEIYFEEMKFTSTWTPRDLFYLFGWGHPPSEKFGEKPYPGEAPYRDADHSQLRPEYVRKYQSALRQYWDHMKEKGWADKVVIYISDEPHADPEMKEQVMAVCDMIHEVDPEIPIYISTWWYRPEFEGYVDVWGVSHRGGGWGHPVPAEHLERAVNNGGQVYFTTDGMQCTDSPFLAFERMLPYFCFKYGASEYEFWASNWHTLDPYKYGWHRWHRQSPSADVWYWMRYPNGDGNFIYPGEPLGVEELVPSVRLKQAREGVEDYEFMHRLDQEITKARAKGVNTSMAQKALDRAKGLVTIPCADGRYTTDYMPDPDLLMEIRHEVALAIEALNALLTD